MSRIGREKCMAVRFLINDFTEIELEKLREIQEKHHRRERFRGKEGSDAE